MYDLSNFRNGKIVSALCMGTDRAFHKTEPDIEKALDPALVFLRGTTNLFKFVDVIGILSISAEQIRQPDMQVRCLVAFGKLLCIF